MSDGLAVYGHAAQNDREQAKENITNLSPCASPLNISLLNSWSKYAMHLQYFGDEGDSDKQLLIYLLIINVSLLIKLYIKMPPIHIIAIKLIRITVIFFILVSFVGDILCVDNHSDFLCSD